MSEFIKFENPIMCVVSECAERQLGSKQDIAAILSLKKEEKEEGDENIDVIAVLDGHGHNISVDIIREEDFYTHFAKSDPAESLQQALDIKISEKKAENDKIKHDYNSNFRAFLRKRFTEYDINSSGATLSFAKI